MRGDETGPARSAPLDGPADRDPLTGLATRAAFDRSAAAAIAAGGPLAVYFIDLDRFRRINDALGHPAGDGVLRTVAGRLTASLRSGDRAARFAGDQFLVLRTGDSAAAAGAAAEALLADLAVPLAVGGRTVSVTASIGVAVFPGDGTTPEALVRHADSAMHGAKSRGRAAVGCFDAGAPAAALDSLTLESQLADAVAHGEFELHFQPQVGAADGRVRGAEALIRWRHPTRGLLGADAFIPLAEERQLMLPIGQWVLREAAHCALRWRAAGLHFGAVAVNLSNVQFQSIGFVEAVAAVLPETGVGPDQPGAGLIELELTERMLMDDLAQVRPRLARLKAMGLSISIDDFGTGYSSLAHLIELPIDKLKIDRAFVRGLPDDRRAAAVLRAIVAMGRQLGMTVIAEGVETAAQRRFLAAEGCDEIQGLLVGPPMPQAGFEAWLARGPGLSRA